jgi:dihydroxy-acid dehydratase
VQDGDVIRIDAEQRRMDVLGIDEAEWQRRREAWTPLPLKATQGTLYKYIKAVTSASTGCVTDA